MLEDRRPPTDPWFSRNLRIVFVGGVIEAFEIWRIVGRLWLR